MAGKQDGKNVRSLQSGSRKWIGSGAGLYLSPTLKDTLFPSMHHLLKIPQTFKTAPTAMDQVFKYTGL